MVDDRVPGTSPIQVKLYKCPACGATKRAADRPECKNDGIFMEPEEEK